MNGTLMPLQKPAAATTQKAQATRENRRRIWNVALAALLVAGILYVPPFTPNKQTNDSVGGYPEIGTHDQPQQGTAQTGTVLVQGDTNKSTRTNRQSGTADYPDATQPVPTPQPMPIVPIAPVLPLPAAVPQPQQPQPVTPPTIEPHQPPVDMSQPQPEPEPVPCEAPQLAAGETQLANNSSVSLSPATQTAEAVYVLTTPDHCSAAWQPLQNDGTILWADDDVGRPVSIIIESQQNPETQMHHSSTLRFRFKLSETTPPTQDQQFSFAVHTEGSDQPVIYTVTATANAATDNTEHDQTDQTAETQP